MMRLFTVTLAVVLTAATTSFAQLPFARQPKQDPYRDLFSPEAERLKTATRTALRRETQVPQRCVDHTMRVVPPNPGVDPKITVAPPSDVEHKIKTVTPPPSCAPRN